MYALFFLFFIGERVIQHYTNNLQVDILINPEIQTLHSKFRNLLKKNVKYRHIVYAGHVFQGSGSWILQDDRLSFSKFVSVFTENDVMTAIKEQSDKILAISAFIEGDWNISNFAKQTFGKVLEIRLNPGTKLDSLSGIQQFKNYMSYYVNPTPVCELLKASDVVGNIRFSRPTLYIFPGCHGDSALFGINGFNILINGGYGRKACFWDFTRHLDRIDALLLSHLGEDNLLGASAVLERKAQDNIHPEIGFVYFNGLDDKQKNAVNGDSHQEDAGAKPLSLLVDLVQEGNKMIENMKIISQAPHPCIGKNLGTTLQPFNLYHKVGHGSLDMYVLHPLQDNKDLKDFFAHWSKQAGSFSSKNGIPLPHLVSIAALLVWKPSSPSEKITRILLPGSITQPKLFDGLDKLKTVDIFKHHECSEESLKAPPPSKSKKTAVSKVPPKASTPSRTPRKEAGDAKESLNKTLPVEKRRPIAKPSSASTTKAATSKTSNKDPIKKIDKKIATKSGTDSDTKSTSSIETPPPVTSEKTSPVESSSTHESVAAVSDISTTDADVSKQDSSVVSPQEEVQAAKSEPAPLLLEEERKPASEDSSPVDTKQSEQSASSSSEAMLQSDQEVVRDAMSSSPFESFGQGSEDKQINNEFAIEEPVPHQAAPVDPFAVLSDRTPDREPSNTQLQAEEVVNEESQLGTSLIKEDVIVEDPPESLPEPDQFDAHRFENITEPDPRKSSGLLDDEKDVDTAEPVIQENVDCLLNSKVDETRDVETTLIGHESDSRNAATEETSPEQVILEDKQNLFDIHTDETTELKDEDAMYMHSDVGEKQREPFDGAQPEGLPEPKEPDGFLEEPCDLVVESRSKDNEIATNEVSKEDVSVENQFSQSLIDSIEGPEMFQEKTNQDSENFDEKRHDNSIGILDLPSKEGDQFTDVSKPMEDNLVSSESQDLPPENRVIDDIESVDTMREPNDNQSYVEPDSLNMSGDSLLDVDQKVSEESQQPPKNIMDEQEVPQQESASLIGLTDSEIIASQLTQSKESNIPFAAEKTPSDNIMEPDSLCEELQGQNLSFDQFCNKDIQQVDQNLLEIGNHGNEQQSPFAGGEQNGDKEFDPLKDWDIPEALQKKDAEEQSKPKEQEEFDPLKEWGQPMGLPSPAPTPGTEKSDQKGARATGKLNTSRVKDSSSGKAPSSRPSLSKSGSKLGSASPSKSTGASKDDSKKATGSSSKMTSKKPASAPPGSRTTAKENGTKVDVKKDKLPSKTEEPKKSLVGTKRMSMGFRKVVSQPKEDTLKADKAATSKTTAKSKPTSASQASKPEPAPVKLINVIPFYVDLAYIPHHGNSIYMNLNYFRRIRARYYVYSSLQPDPSVFESLLTAKQTWDDPSLETIVIPTYDTDVLRLWMAQNRDRLSELKINIAPSASRCTIQLQDHEASCAAYRLEF